MALDESGGYDLARGFDTLISGSKAIEQAVRDLQSSVMAVLAMQRDTTMLASGQSAASMNPVAAAAVQPSPTSGQTVTQPSYSPGQAGGLTTAGVPVTALPRPVGDPQAGATAPAAASPTAGLGLPATPSGDSGSGLLDSVLNVLPFGGTISNAMSFGREQRDKNAQFQMITGGSNTSGISERASMKTYQASTAGMFSGEEADKAFMGMTALGYGEDAHERGGVGRQDALNFAYKQKSANGMTVDESLQHMDVYSKNASAGLTSFSDSLIAVSQAAKESGKNAMEARAMFSQMFGQATAAGFGQGATSFAAATTDKAQGYSLAYSNTVDMSGTTAEGTVRLQAAMMGKTYGQAITSQQSGVNTMAQGQAAGVKHLIGLLPPSAIKWAKEQIAANPDMDDAAVTALGRELLKKSGMDPGAILSIAETFTGQSYNGNYEVVMEEIVRSLMGQGITSSMKSGGLVGMDDNGEMTDDYKKLGTTKSGGLLGTGLFGTETTNETGTAYNAMIEGGGERIGALEQVMNKLDPDEQDEQMVKIGGKEMSLKEIIESGDPRLMKKVAMGKGTMVGGEFEGQKIGEVAVADEEKTDEDEELDTTATDVNVTIDFSQYAKDLLTESHNIGGDPAGSS